MANKVYRTPIGFHDAYVAAPSQKAALQAWGTTKNLFARGDAEIVTDAALTAEPLANPGTIIKRPRGTAAEHVAALPKDTAGTRTKGTAAPDSTKPKRTKPKPHPSRGELDDAIEALTAADDRNKDDLARIEHRIEKLQRERDTMVQKHKDNHAALEDTVIKAKAAYDAAMRKWRG